MSRNFTRICFSAAVIILVIWLSIRYLLPIALPFLLGLWLALAAEPMVRLLNSKLRLPRWASSAISVSLVFLLTVLVLVVLLGALMRQLTRLQDLLPQLEAAITQGLQLLRQWLQELAGRLPGGLRNTVKDLLENSLSGGGPLAQQIMEKIPQILTQLAGRLSSSLFGLLTGIISGYMISGRLPKIKETAKNNLPESWHTRYLPALRGMRKALGGWLLAQLKLAGVAFVLLLLGFWVLRIGNCFLLAALITLVDAFPVLGVGTVMLPWSVICLLQQQYSLGAGLFAVYAIIWMTRSVLEPRLVGKGLGLDPLLTLLSIYAGWQLLGIAGMLLAPIFTMAAVHMMKALKR